MSKRFPDQVRDTLLAAGWSPGRAVPLAPDLPADYALFPAAEAVLREFGGLHIGSAGPGLECATSDLLVSPASAAGLGEHTGVITASGARLFPLGEFHHGHGYLLIDEAGTIYNFFEDLGFYAPCFERALCQLALGLNPTPADSA